MKGDDKTPSGGYQKRYLGDLITKESLNLHLEKLFPHYNIKEVYNNENIMKEIFGPTYDKKSLEKKMKNSMFANNGWHLTCCG